MSVEVMEFELAVICLSASFRKRALSRIADFWRHISLGLYFSSCTVSLGWLASKLVRIVFLAYS